MYSEVTVFWSERAYENVKKNRVKWPNDGWHARLCSIVPFHYSLSANESIQSLDRISPVAKPEKLSFVSDVCVGDSWLVSDCVFWYFGVDLFVVVWRSFRSCAIRVSFCFRPSWSFGYYFSTQLPFRLWLVFTMIYFFWLFIIYIFVSCLIVIWFFFF